MRKLVFIVVVLMSVGLFAQTSSGGTSGIRIGSGNPTKHFNPEVNFQASTNTVEINTADAAISEVELYDENNNLVGTASVGSNNFSTSLNSLPTGSYTIVMVSEEDEVQVGVIYKP